MTASDHSLDDHRSCQQSKVEGEQIQPDQQSYLRKALEIVKYTPKRCRYDPENPPQFSLALNLLFGFAATFTVANLYYNHPILNILADDFHVSNERASLIPTLAQAGYACGLLFLCPLGDLVPRRPFVLILVWFTATAWIGLCVTTSFPAFLFLSFLTSLTTVTPQLMLPLVGDLAPSNRRATAISIVVSGLLLGILIARALSGIVTNFVSWRIIYWIAFALQSLILLLLYLFLPDYPSTNPSSTPLPTLPAYLRTLLSILTMLLHHPILVQACLIGLTTATTFTSYWTTLTFLLSGPLYAYPPLTIGLFALIGIFALAFGPAFARSVIDRLPTPLYSVILGECFCLAGILLGTFAGTHSIAGPIIQAFLLDLGVQTSQIANRSAIYAIEPKGRNRVNTAFMVSVFVGQLVGTAVGNRLYAVGGPDGGGWMASGGCSAGFVVVALGLCVVRGPNEEGWVGWGGGWPRWRRGVVGGDGDDEAGSGGGMGEAGGGGDGGLQGRSTEGEKTLDEVTKEGVGSDLRAGKAEEDCRIGKGDGGGLNIRRCSEKDVGMGAQKQK